MSVVERVGAAVLSRVRDTWHLWCVCGAVILIALKPASWPRTVRDILSRQILFTGIHALWFIIGLSGLLGVLLVLQAQNLLVQVGRTDLVGSLIADALIQYTGPLLVHFVIIGRSGTAITTELANMRVRGEIDVLDSQGFDPLAYLVMPRVIGMMVSTFCLTVVFVLGALFIGYLAAFVSGVSTLPPDVFMANMFREITPFAMVAFVARALIPALITGTICCVTGLNVNRSITEVPQAVTRAVMSSIVMLFVVLTIITLALSVFQSAWREG